MNVKGYNLPDSAAGPMYSVAYNGATVSAHDTWVTVTDTGRTPTKSESWPDGCVVACVSMPATEDKPAWLREVLVSRALVPAEPRDFSTKHAQAIIEAMAPTHPIVATLLPTAAPAKTTK